MGNELPKTGLISKINLSLYIMEQNNAYHFLL